ncbi:UNVERIFIED_CONTAM: hypothetical protein GTU68_031604 [Idotea baltica]|nr:hypothetical protein [Idotea baltica]
MSNNEVSFGIIDYCCFIATLAISFCIGVATAFKGNKSPEEFLMGNRSFGCIPVAMSLLTSFISAINFIGFSTEVYVYGLQISTMMIGVIFGILFSGYVVLPVIYPLKLTSINEYIELRFKSATLRSFMMVLVVLQSQVYMGLVLYAPSIALAAVTPFDYTTYIIVMGVLCTIYSTVGGIRAVVWTDVFQFIVLMIGLVAIVVAGVIGAGGIGNVISKASEGGRLEVLK